MATLTYLLARRGELTTTRRDQLVAAGYDDETALRLLIEDGTITSAQAASARAARAGVPFVVVADLAVDQSAVAMVPSATARRHTLLPVARENGRLVVAMVDPSDVLAIDDVRQSAGVAVLPVGAEESDLLAAIDRFHRVDSELNDITATLQEEEAAVEIGFDLPDAGDDDAPIVRFVNLLVSQAVQDRASDIHIEPGERGVRVRFRVDGVLQEMPSAPKHMQQGIISRLKIMSDIDIAERRRPQDGRMSVMHGDRKVDLRVATLPTVWGEKVVMRILDTGGQSLHLSDLGLLPHNLETYQTSFRKPYGMILVTGPTGSGKSTTLYTTLNEVARTEVNVITVEDPVEYRMPGVNQVQVHNKAGLTFAAALRSILRSDPDVVLVGEIRDHETAQIAIEAALTGHLVLSTLHTNDAPSAITRLTEMGIEPFLVGSALDAVVAQRLARRLCLRCKEPDPRSAEHFQAMGFDASGELDVHRAVGCTHCGGTGYRGRVAIHEVMTVTEEIERLTVARASASEIAKVAMAQGMRTLRQDAWAKARLGLTTVEEVQRVIV
ncbi:ATPase, T2SS/T4P/T4SS family [Agrococcus sp. SL85]|uniref:GspE/PulE family protein n=1 Tax=Agrococcus sp. SL85 TaxID=2995141 RepID=UPI00226CEA8C|nr:ATPase, T2SS/T4P/T4SS family [Agrococcus sp. SL85]WAC66372.1 ATPase, T2SS/T4P/T4SS family [Agrococcus sp. SL85]